MKRIAPRHPLAVLRKKLGLGQKELADFAGCSTKMIQKIELRKRKIPERLAFGIHIRTGISEKWLLDGNANAPALDWAGQPYTRDIFRTWKKRLKATDEQQTLKRCFCALVEAIIDDGASHDAMGETCFELAFRLRSLFPHGLSADMEKRWCEASTHQSPPPPVPPTLN